MHKELSLISLLSYPNCYPGLSLEYFLPKLGPSVQQSNSLDKHQMAIRLNASMALILNFIARWRISNGYVHWTYMYA